jgi:hypothetical protein
MEYGGEVRVPAEHRHVIAAEPLSPGPLNLPTDATYNIHIKESQQNPGPIGSAQGRSDAQGDGNAACEAVGENGGSASAQFNLGHRIDNLATSPQKVRLELTFLLEEELEASENAAPETLASASLVFVVLDSRQHPVARLSFVDTTTDAVRTVATDTEKRSVTFQFEPDETYDIMLFAKVSTAAAPDQRARARLAVKSLQMQFAFVPVTTQPAAG